MGSENSSQSLDCENNCFEAHKNEENEEEGKNGKLEKRKKKRRKRNWVERNGEIKIRKYTKKREVFCGFCSISSREEFDKRLGSFYGRVDIKGKNLYFHELCLRYSPLAYSGKKSSILFNVKSEILRSRKLVSLIHTFIFDT